MAKEWQELTKMTQGASLVVEKVRLVEKDIVLEGSFKLPPLACLIMEDQVFVTAFVRSHGSIKDMEKVFGISYPTVKNRLNLISQQLELAETNRSKSGGEVPTYLEKAEISVDDAAKKSSGGR